MSDLILLTGATGYVGGRMLSRLQAEGIPVRCMTRRIDALSNQVGPSTEVVQGDVFDPASLRTAFEGVHTAYYFVHSMGDDRDFESQDRIAAENFAKAATAAGVRRLVYLGGLGNPDEKLSKHLRSRQETGDILRAHHSQVIEFRASIVIGSGSLSFEMIRALVERLPIMICPRWVQVKAQPIAIEDLLAYLVAALKLPNSDSKIFEIGGPDQVSYGELMQEYARQRGLRRWMIPVPLLTPYLSSLWLGLVTPLYARVGRKLVESLRNPTLVSNNLAESVFKVQPRSVRNAVARALINEDREFAETRWSDALSSAGKPRAWGGDRFGSRLVDSRTVNLSLTPEQAFLPIRRIGGQTGWYYGNWLWKLRGFIDLLIGGVGVRRGRRDPDQLRVGESLDFWRVEAFEPNKKLRLRAEMKVPGRAWLEFEVSPGNQGSTIRQTAIFDPQGLAGLLYWYGIYPLHQFVFAGMLRNLGRAAEDQHRDLIDQKSLQQPRTTSRQLYVKQTKINAAPETVFRFHESPDALLQLIPPWENMKPVESDGSLQPGSKVILQGKLGFIPIRWIAVHTEYDPPHLFADRQESGPFRYWYHRHRFLDDGQGRTLLRDEVEYTIPLGVIGRWLGGWFILRKLEAMFTFRHEKTQSLIEAAETNSNLKTSSEVSN